MKKIPTLFERVFENHAVIHITDRVTPGCEKALTGELIPTLKIDGSCCAIIDGVFYKRYDAKKGKKAPEGAIPCGAPDPVTGHWPHWVKCSADDPSDKWFLKAYQNAASDVLFDGTYEAIGPHFQGNPYGISEDVLLRHGWRTLRELYGPQTPESLCIYLIRENIEGIVWWDDHGPVCKLKRTDFGLEWPVKGVTQP